MTTFSKSGFQSLNYNSFRPHYPPSFYKILLDYVHKDSILNTIDVGCGTGVATFPLLNFSKNVVGLDLSPRMIESANKLKHSRLEQMGISDESRIQFQESAVEDFDAPPQSFDLITAAQCIHWFKDFDQFFASAAKHLRTDGVLAYWYYVDPIVVDFEGPYDKSQSKSEIIDKCNKIYHKLVYDDPEYLGPCWEQPGREYLKNFLEEVDKHIPSDLYNDVVINKYLPGPGKSAKETDLLLAKKNITLEDFRNYVSTYSSYHNFREKTNNEDFLDFFVQQFVDELGWDRLKTKLDMDWFTGYTFMRRK